MTIASAVGQGAIFFEKKRLMPQGLDLCFCTLESYIVTILTTAFFCFFCVAVDPIAKKTSQVADSQRKDVKILWTYLISSAILVVGTIVLSIVSQSIPTAAFLIPNAAENFGSWAMLVASTLVLVRSDDALRNQPNDTNTKPATLKESNSSSSSS